MMNPADETCFASQTRAENELGQLTDLRKQGHETRSHRFSHEGITEGQGTDRVLLACDYFLETLRVSWNSDEVLAVSIASN